MEKFIPLEKYEFAWYFTDPMDPVPADDLVKIKPLCKEYSAQKWKEWIDPIKGHPMTIGVKVPVGKPFAVLYSEWQETTKVQKFADDLKQSCTIKENEPLFLFWHRDFSVMSEWGIFLKYMSNFCFDADESFIIVLLNDPRAWVCFNGMNCKSFCLVDRKQYFGLK